MSENNFIALQHARTEAVAQAIREHESKTQDWAFHQIAGRMNALYDRLNEKFFQSRLPKAVIAIGPDLILRYGYYRLGRDEIGARFRIHLNSRHFARSEAQVATTLLHEMVHVSQHLFGHIGHRHRYHNKEFVNLAASVGIHAKLGSGVTLGITDELTQTLEAMGFSPSRALWPGMDDSPIQKPLRKVMWNCPCGQEAWVERGIQLNAVCDKCHERFTRPGDMWLQKGVATPQALPGEGLEAA